VSVYEAALVGLGVVMGYMVALWAVSLFLRNASIVDVFWGPGFIAAAGTYFTLSDDGYEGRQLLVLVLVAIWAVRLGGYILARNAGHGEDPRYRKWRQDSPATFWWRSLFQVFLLQGLTLWVISAPLLAALHNAEPDALVATDFIGLAIWSTGFFFEAVGDWQLARFKSDPANVGKVMDRGLWRYTRHPNYFGDATLWWGFFVIVAGTTDGWLTIFSPAVMTFLLLRVSGVALLERGMTRRRPDYEDYVRRTSAFIPLPPKPKSGA
jgi:steroid 5-alpha reductase family enzyme